MTPADTLARKVSGLVGRYTALSADRRRQARGHKAEASYLYGAAAAFEVVATELGDALGKHGPVPRVAQVPHLSVLAEGPVDESSVDDHQSPGDFVDAPVHASLDGEEMT